MSEADSAPKDLSDFETFMEELYGPDVPPRDSFLWELHSIEHTFNEERKTLRELQDRLNGLIKRVKKERRAADPTVSSLRT